MYTTNQWSLENAKAGLKLLDYGVSGHEDATYDDLNRYSEWLASCWPECIDFLCQGVVEGTPDYLLKNRIDKFHTLRWAVLDLVDKAGKLTREQAIKIGEVIVKDINEDRMGLQIANVLGVVANKCPEFVEVIAGLWPENRHGSDWGFPTVYSKPMAKYEQSLRLNDDLLPRFAEQYCALCNDKAGKMLFPEWPLYDWAMPSAAKSFVQMVESSQDLSNHDKVRTLIQVTYNVVQRVYNAPSDDQPTDGRLSACLSMLRKAEELQRLN